MYYPSFYADIAPIELYDPLADFLGAAEQGRIAIDYLDCVKLAGHSCPTVAGAYIMAQEGLAVLYPDTTPHRSGIRVELSGTEAEGVVGVVGSVIRYITGAGASDGFKGISGQFARNNRLHYGVPFDGDVRLSRIDTGASVMLRYDPSAVPSDPEMKSLMHAALHHTATPEEIQRFRALWQGRTRAILTAQNRSPFLTLSFQGSPS